MTGETLKLILAKHDWSGRKLAKAMDKAPRTVYDWFAKDELKDTIIERIAYVTKIPQKEFQRALPEANPKVETMHHGTNVQNTLESKGVKVEHLAKKMQVSRKTLYQWLKEKQWDQGKLLNAAHILNVPVAQLKGMGEGKQGFEKEIYNELRQIRQLLEDIKKTR